MSAADLATRLVAEQLPDIADLFPFKNAYSAKTHNADGAFFLTLDFYHGSGLPSVGDLSPQELRSFAALPNPFSGTALELRKILGPEAYSLRRFSYAGPAKDGALSFPHFQEHLVSWINDVALPEVLRLNEARVLRAIPTPPQVDIGLITRATWVLECETSIRQGTAFILDGIGMVTCDHVIGPDTLAFHPSDVAKKYPVSVLRREAAIDLAVLTFPAEDTPALTAGSADVLKQMDHISIFGYPNYRVGDTGTVVPGLVVGFRTISAIRRILTNAPIVGGASGAPVVDRSGRVVGIAATGADRMETAQDTEHHSIIPIEALRLVKSAG